MSGRGKHHTYGSVAEQAEAAAPAPIKTPLPTPPGKRLSEDQIFEYIASLSPTEDWPHAMLYLYRYWPIIDRKLTDPDNPNYIEAISEPYTVEDLKRRHGSGSYSIKMNDLNRPKGQTVCESTFTINDPEAPPVLDVREVVRGHVKNASYVQGLIARGELPKENPMQQQSAPSTDAQTAALLVPLIREMMNSLRDKKPENVEGQLMQKVIDTMSKASDKSIEMALRQVKPEASATDQLVMFDKIIGLVEKMKGDNKPAAVDPLMSHILEELREERRANRTLMEKLFERKANVESEDEPKGMVKTVMETLLQRALDGIDSGGGGHQLKWWQEQMPTFITEGNKALGQLKDLAAMFFFNKANAAGFPRPAANTPGAALPAAEPTPAPGGETNMNPNPMVQILNEITPPLIEHLKSEELTGRDFAEWFIYGLEGTGTGGYGPRAFKQVQGIGKQTLLSACKNHPPIASQLVGVSDERIATFLDDFFLGPPDDDDAESGTVEVIQPGKTRRGKKGEEQ